MYAPVHRIGSQFYREMNGGSATPSNGQIYLSTAQNGTREKTKPIKRSDEIAIW